MVTGYGLVSALAALFTPMVVLAGFWPVFGVPYLFLKFYFLN
jgi:hypothetical protein